MLASLCPLWLLCYAPHVWPPPLPPPLRAMAPPHRAHIHMQIIICRGKERVMSEKTVTVRWGATLVAGYSKVLASTDHARYEDWVSAVQAEWDSLWAAVYGAADASSEFGCALERGLRELT